MKCTFREVLAYSHIAAVGIAVLIAWSVDSGAKALLSLLILAFEFSFGVVKAGSMWWQNGINLIGSWDMLYDRALPGVTVKYFFWTVIRFGAAWIVSRCVYGVGALRTLSTYRVRITRRDYA